MKLLDIFIEPAGRTLRLMTRPNDDVATYVVFVRKRTSGGPVPEATWLPDLLESAEGASLILAPERGYDLTLKASVKSGGNAVIVPNLTIDDNENTSYTTPIALPDAEGPVVERGWSVVIQ
jgi:hypothetical protein